MASWLFRSSPEWSCRGKNVLITGASSGIGAELARNFARGGASLALLARNKEALEEVARDCRNFGAPSAHVFPCDLTDNGNIESAVRAAVLVFNGNVDVVVLNAGRSQGCYFEEIKDVAAMDYLLRLNVNGVINTLHYALPSVPKTRRSRIVLISSVSGLIPVPYRTVYCASKHALTGFANALRLELCDAHTVEGAPTVQLINPPEVRGTVLNDGRMTMGADRPPARFKVTPALVSVEEAGAQFLQEIVRGTREWGQPPKVRLLQAIFNTCPNRFLDSLITRIVKRSHYRPDER